MKDSDVMFNTIFGWSTVVLAILLITILVVYARSLLVFKNAKVIKGKVIDLMDIGELDLPTIEYQLNGEILAHLEVVDVPLLQEFQERLIFFTWVLLVVVFGKLMMLVILGRTFLTVFLVVL